uniref:Carbonyl reductase [NADPH] 3 n=1 Tax=Gongylonema pulchrum TaxID=637853 RepID=A0A183E930_9BILA
LGTESLKKAVQELGKKRHSDVRYHQLDITNRDSCQNLATFLKIEHDGLDVLINNAGFAFKHDAKEPPEEQARVTIGVNYEGTKQVCDVLFPLIRNGGRVVNVCSSEGILSGRYSDDIIARLTSPSLTVADVDKFVEDYKKVVNVCSSEGILSGRYSDDIIARLTSPSLTVADVDKFVEDYKKACIGDKRKENGFPQSAYKVSKAAEIALTLIQAKELMARNILVNAHATYRACIGDKRKENGFPQSAYKVSKAAEIALTLIQAKELMARNILVNACHPGYVNTDMTSHQGPLSIEEGADTPIYLAIMEGNEPTGKLYYKRRIIDWNAPFHG